MSILQEMLIAYVQQDPAISFSACKALLICPQEFKLFKLIYNLGSKADHQLPAASEAQENRYVEKENDLATCLNSEPQKQLKATGLSSF